MKKLFVLSLLLTSYSWAAIPTFNSFESTQFGTNSLKVVVKSAAPLTNITARGTWDISANLEFNAVNFIRNQAQDASWYFLGETDGINEDTVVRMKDIWATNAAQLVSAPAATQVPGKLVTLHGRVTAGDGGGGVGFITSGGVTNLGTRIQLDGTNVFERIYTGPVNVKWFGAAGDGVADDTSAIINAAASAPTNGWSVSFPPGTYLITSPITIPDGVSFIGEAFPGDSGVKSGGEMTGAILLMRATAQLQYGRGFSIKGFTIYYDQQKYSIAADGGQPDGLEPFTSYTATFRPIQSGKATIEDILYIGGTQFYQALSTNNPEKLIIRNIYGCPLQVGIQIDRCTDVVRFEDIHWNVNSYNNLISGSNTNFFTKVAKNAIAFKMGRIDSGTAINCFFYGFRDILDATVNSYGSCSMDLISCAGDNVHTVMRYEQGTNGFGSRIIGGWYTTTVYNPIINQMVSTEKPSLVRIADNASRVRVQIVGVRTHGTGSELITDSAAAEKVIYIPNVGNTLSRVILSNSDHDSLNNSDAYTIDKLVDSPSPDLYVTAINARADGIEIDYSTILQTFTSGLKFDGSTANSRVNYTLSATIGVADFTEVFSVKAQTTSPATSQVIGGFTSANNSIFGANAAYLMNETDGTLRFVIRDGAGASLRNATVYDGFNRDFGGVNATIVIARTVASSNLVCFINGRKIFSETHADWQGSVSGTYWLIGSGGSGNYFNGDIYQAFPISTAYTRANVLQLLRSGITSTANVLLYPDFESFNGGAFVSDIKIGKIGLVAGSVVQAIPRNTSSTVTPTLNYDYGASFTGVAGSYFTFPVAGTTNTSDFTIIKAIRVPTAAPASSQILGGFSSAQTNIFAASTAYVLIESNGSLQFSTRNSGASLLRNASLLTPFISNYGGKPVTIFITRAGTTLSAYINNLKVFAETHADWGNAIAQTHWIVGGSGNLNVFDGMIYASFPVASAFTTTDIDNYLLGGMMLASTPMVYPDFENFNTKTIFDLSGNNKTGTVGGTVNRAYPKPLLGGYLATAANRTLGLTDKFVNVTTTATITLPAAATVGPGKDYYILSSTGVTTTVARTGGDTINGAASDDSLAANTASGYISDGVSNWQKF